MEIVQRLQWLAAKRSQPKCEITFLFQTFDFSAYLHDAIELYAAGLNRSVSRGGNKSDGVSIISNITSNNVIFQGKSIDTMDLTGQSVGLDMAMDARHSDSIVTHCEAFVIVKRSIFLG